MKIFLLPILVLAFAGCGGGGEVSGHPDGGQRQDVFDAGTPPDASDAGTPPDATDAGTPPDATAGGMDGSTVNVSEVSKQEVRLGVDAERLWHWRSYLKDELAQVAVGEMQSTFVRVAINCAYEREEGVINASAYDEIVEMMTAMKTANPNILFFASPRPLAEAYTNAEAVAEWGHTDNIPWSPYPRWILKWVQDGTETIDGTVVPRWVQDSFDVPALVEYYADYLNLMHAKGFAITFLDATNEKSVVTPAINKYIYDNLPGRLNPGVHMPEMIVPSSWNILGGTNWLATVDVSKQEHTAFNIAAVHNTGAGGTTAEFVAAATSMGKEPWNTEMHGWTGVALRDEILNSAVFWDHMRAGFVGIETWLFFGALGGADHPMIWSHWADGTIIKTGKYEIFKQVVNNANGGRYVDVSMPLSSTMTAAFVKGSILSIWVLNRETATIPDVQFNLGNRSVQGKSVDVVRWHETLPNAGLGSSFTATQPHGFAHTLAGESLYFFRINLTN